MICCCCCCCCVIFAWVVYYRKSVKKTTTPIYMDPSRRLPGRKPIGDELEISPSSVPPHPMLGVPVDHIWLPGILGMDELTPLFHWLPPPPPPPPPPAPPYLPPPLPPCDHPPPPPPPPPELLMLLLLPEVLWVRSLKRAISAALAKSTMMVVLPSTQLCKVRWAFWASSGVRYAMRAVPWLRFRWKCSNGPCWLHSRRRVEPSIWNNVHVAIND